MSQENVEKYRVETFENYTISVALFQDLKNVLELKQRIIEKDIDGALISPKLICDTFQVLCAATKAIHGQQLGIMKTRNLNSEIIFCLSPSGNISDSLKRFGVSPEDVAVLAVCVNDKDGSKMATAIDCIDGQLTSLDQLKRFTEEDRLMKTYKISDAELKHGTLVDAVVTRIATKDCT